MNERWTQELSRKSVHFLGLSSLILLYYNRWAFVGIATAYLFFYLWLEWTTLHGGHVPFLSALLVRCKRDDEKDRMAQGGIAMVVACIMTATFFGTRPAAIGLSQIFVADVFASLAGMKWGKTKLFYSPSKSWVGTMAFFLAASFISRCFVPWNEALVLGAVGSLMESLPIKDWDNLTVPMTVSCMAYFWTL